MGEYKINKYLIEGLLDKVQPLDYKELNNKKVTLLFGEENGYGILAARDETGKIYLIKEVIQ